MVNQRIPRCTRLQANVMRCGTNLRYSSENLDRSPACESIRLAFIMGHLPDLRASVPWRLATDVARQPTSNNQATPVASRLVAVNEECAPMKWLPFDCVGTFVAQLCC